MGETTNTPKAAGRILVTGANGQLGKELQALSVACPQYDFVFLSKEQLPVDHFETVRSIFKKYNPEYCINCAAYTAVDKAESEKELAFRVNGDAAGVMASLCRENDCRFIHISTDYVFDGTATVPYTEDAGTDPQSVYGASKLEGERQTLHFNPAAIIIRTSWVYSGHGKNFVKTMIKLMKDRAEIGVVNDQFGSPTYAADLAEAILQMIGSLPARSSQVSDGGIYHFSNQGIISWYDIAVAIKEIAGLSCKINAISTSQFPTAAKRPAYSVLDKTKIQKTFGIKLKDWKQSLARCIGKLERYQE